MSHLPTRPSGRIVRREDAGLWLQGQAVLAAAQRDAEQLRARAEEDRQRWHAEAVAQGLAEGHAQAAAAFAQQHAAQDRWLAAVEPALAQLALDIARQLIGELPSAERSLALAHTALTQFRRDQALTLQVPPAEAEAVRALANHQGLALSIQGNDRLAPGQARLASAQGAVELGIEQQLAHLRQALSPEGEALP